MRCCTSGSVTLASGALQIGYYYYMYNIASYCSVCNIEVTDDGEALECDECYVKKLRSSRDNAVTHDSQLITRFYGVTS